MKKYTKAKIEIIIISKDIFTEVSTEMTFDPVQKDKVWGSLS